MPSDDTLILTVVGNGVPRGDFTLLRRAGDYWVAAEDLGRLRVEPHVEARREQNGEAYYSLRGLGAGDLRFDESTLTLSLMFSPETFAGTQVNLSHMREATVPTSSPRSLILSYRLSAQGAASVTSTTLENALNVRLGKLLLRQETRLSSMAQSRGFARGVTQLVWDEPAIATRFAAGDVISTAGPFGSGVTAAGVLVQRVYDMKPDLIRQPTARVHALAALPSDVVVDVDGSPVFRGSVGPGPIDINNLLQYGGMRNIRVTITDASGRREVIDRPFFFTNTVLAQGLHEFSYFAGRRSELGADFRWRYREGAWQAYHRYGVTDSVSAGIGGEGSPDFINAGAGVALRSDTLGVTSFEALTSRDHARDTVASGWSARHTYSAPLGSVFLGRRLYNDGFRTFATGPFTPFAKSETSLGLSSRIDRYNVGAEWSRTIDTLGPRSSASVRASTDIGTRRSISLELLSSRQPDRRDLSVFIQFRMELDARSWVTTNAEKSRTGHAITAEAGSTLPQGEGTGWRAGLTRNSTLGDLAFGNATWNLPKATLDVNASSGLGANAASYGSVAVSGALAAVDGYWGVTRRVDDSFAVARLGVPQQGVEVSINSQVQGTTDAQGMLLIPQVTSYNRQQVAVNDKQLGLQYSLQERQHSVVPAYRSGMIVDFGGTEMHALAGYVWRRSGNERAALSSRSIVLRGPRGTVNIDTGAGGDFYAENVLVGRYTGAIEHDGRKYICSLDVPAFTEAVLELPEGITCD